MSTIDEARQLFARGDVAGASKACLAALAASSSAAEAATAHALLAACFRSEGNAAAGLAHAREAVAIRPDDAGGHYALAECLDDTGDKSGAIASLRRALAARGGFVQAHRYLGLLLADTHDLRGAAQSFARAVELDPRHARTWCNLGSAQQTQGLLQDALVSFRRALAVQPDYPIAECNLAMVLRDLGRADEAESLLRRSLQRQPLGKPLRMTIVVLAGLLQVRGELDEAAKLYRQAIELSPEQSSSEHFNLGEVLATSGNERAAKESYRTALRLRPGHLRAALGAHLTLPMVYAGAASVREARAGYVAGLAALESEIDGILSKSTPDQVVDGLRWSNFFLAYQCGDDRELQERYAALAARAIDTADASWRVPMRAEAVVARRIRVGFASAFLHFGTVGQYFLRWITELDRERFEVFVYELRPMDDSVTAALKARAAGYRVFTGAGALPSRVGRVIRGDALDILIYPELGMDATTFALSALRLAPRQYVAWGHPVTTGHATIDGFFTCEAMEPPGAEAHYTEALIRLPGIGTSYPRPTLAAAVEREAFGLPPRATLLLCPQSLFKIHPDNDDVFARVLAGTPSTVLVLFAERYPAITNAFMQRLAIAFERHGMPIRERTRVLPRVSHEDYLRINLACDLMLDTLHWSGGNTTLDAIACGLPLVTLAGPHMRGRQSAAMLRMIGLPELVATDTTQYVRIAGDLAGDGEWRNTIRQTMRDRGAAIFEDPAPLAALQVFLETAAASQR